MHGQSRGPVLSPRGPVTFCSAARSYISSMPQYLRKKALIPSKVFSFNLRSEWCMVTEGEERLAFWSTLWFLTHMPLRDTLCRAGWALCYGGVIHTEFIRLRCSVCGVFGVFTSLAASSTSRTFYTPKRGPSPSASPLYPPSP